MDTPHVLTEPRDVAAYAAALAAGSGPIAIDAERASGFRYSQRAYLLQVKRTGAGIALIDPVAVPDLTDLAAAMTNAEWILHAATQDLPCLFELGLRPTTLFDTELAGRLLGRERVSLAALVAEELGVTLVKGHGAADWSKRPLSDAQLRYAALDVDHLIELRDRLATALAEARKAHIASEEFTALLNFEPRERGPDPWRRLSGVHRLKSAEQLGRARALWWERDRLASAQDIAPGRLLKDVDLVALAADLTATPDDPWHRALKDAIPLSAAELSGKPAGKLPPTKSWADRNPIAGARWALARPALVALAEQMHLPLENLMTPELVRRMLWDPPEPLSAIGEEMRIAGARPWQIAAVAPIIEEACQTAALEVTDQ
jgi:ribonuclease D